MAGSSKDDDTLAIKFAFYGSYHNNPWNQLIHVIFVPLIWWSFVVLGTSTGPLIGGSANNGIVELNGGSLILLAYVGFYFYLGDYIVALSYNALLVALYAAAMHVSRTYPSSVISVFVVGQVLGWGMQVVVGHGMIEGRKAAILDSLFDALFMAPIFTWYEMLFFFGFRKDFKKRVQVLIDQRIKQMDASKGAASAPAAAAAAQPVSSSAPAKSSAKKSSRKAQ